MALLFYALSKERIELCVDCLKGGAEPDGREVGAKTPDAVLFFFSKSTSFATNGSNPKLQDHFNSAVNIIKNNSY